VGLGDARLAVVGAVTVGELIVKLATFPSETQVRVDWDYDCPLTVTQEAVEPHPGQPREEFVYIQGES
jgi:hypothetical protein